MALAERVFPVATTISTDSLNDTIASCLECPVCCHTMSEPIFQCRRGHSFCGNCTKKISACAMCMEPTVDVRNLTLEDVARKILLPCENAKYGCNIKATSTLLKDHHTKCIHRKYECIIENCNWKGPRDDIVPHFKMDHLHMGWMVAENYDLFYDSFDITEDFTEHDLITAFDKIFFYHFKRDATNKKIYVVVQFIGPEYQASNYSFKFILTSRNHPLRVIQENYTASDSESLESLYGSGKAISISYDTLTPFIGDDSCLHFELHICRWAL